MTDRRKADRRDAGRRLADRIARERAARHSRLEDPAAIAAWELEWERASRARARHLADLQRVALSFKYAAG